MLDCIPSVNSVFYDSVDFSVRMYSYRVHKLFVTFYIFLFGCLIWCTRNVSTLYVFLLDCLTLVHSLCVNNLYFPVRFSHYGALVMCQQFIFSC